ncbi:MAG: AraC family transcriptional regulator [Pseudomonadota bacterium]
MSDPLHFDLDCWVAARAQRDSIDMRFSARQGYLVVAALGTARRITWKAGRQTSTARIGKGFLAILPLLEGGRLTCDEDSITAHTFISCERLARCARTLGLDSSPQLPVRLGICDPNSLAVIDMLCEHAAARTPATRMMAENCLDLLGLRLLALAQAEREGFDGRRRGLAEWQVARVTTHIRANIDNPLTLDELATLVGLSRYHFCTAFRLATGYTPYEWVSAQRIDRATIYLRETDISVTEIALAVGYETPSAFTARFKRQTGMTPSEYRRRDPQTARTVAGSGNRACDVAATDKQARIRMPLLLIKSETASRT